MGILPSCSHVSTTVWLHHSDLNEMLGDKARWELHNDSTFCFEQILEAAPYYREAELSLPTILQTVQERWTRCAEQYGRKTDNLISKVLQWTPAHGQSSVSRPAKTYSHQLYVNSGCHQDGLLRPMIYRDGYQESTPWWWWWWWW